MGRATTAQQFVNRVRVFQLLKEDPKPSYREIARRLKISYSTVRGIVNRWKDTVQAGDELPLDQKRPGRPKIGDPRFHRYGVKWGRLKLGHLHFVQVVGPGDVKTPRLEPEATVCRDV